MGWLSDEVHPGAILGYTHPQSHTAKGNPTVAYGLSKITLCLAQEALGLFQGEGSWWEERIEQGSVGL